MGGWIVLIGVFCLIQALMRRKERKQTVFNWREAAEIEGDQDCLRQERLAMLPGYRERVEQCYEPLEKIQADWAAWQAEMADEFAPEELLDEPAAVFYTHALTDRAIVVRRAENYEVCFERLDLIRETVLAKVYTPGMPFGSWQASYPSRFFEFREEAERIAEKAMQWLN